MNNRKPIWLLMSRSDGEVLKVEKSHLHPTTDAPGYTWYRVFTRAEIEEACENALKILLRVGGE